MDKDDFEEFVKLHVETPFEVLQTIQKSFNIDGIEDPYEYVKTIQQNFNYASIPFSDEYYNILGIEKP